MQNYMPMMAEMSKSKLKVEFRYGGRLFSATGSSNISAVNSGIWSKFGTQIVFTFLNVRRHKTGKQKWICDGMAVILKIYITS